MRARMVIALCVSILALALSNHSDCLDVGALSARRAIMAQSNVPKVPDGAGQPAANIRVVTVPLKELPNPGEYEDQYGLRFKIKYHADMLGDLLPSIQQRGLLEPLQVAKGKDGKWDIICGHRRAACLHILAARGVQGFSPDMSVQCLEVLNASHPELLVRSLADNELGQKLDATERLLGVKKLDDAGVSKREIAATVNVSEKAIDRDLRIVRTPRVLQHVIDENLPPSTAATLVVVATKAERLDEFLDHFDIWAQLMEDQIQQEDRRSRQERGKGLPPNKMSVMSRLEPHLVRGWIEALAKKKPLTEVADLGFEATFDKKGAKARIKVAVDALNDPVDHLARVAGQVSQVAKHLAAFAKKRRELEAPEGPQAALQGDDTFIDRELLKQFGLEDIADQLEMELRVEEKPTSEDESDEGNEAKEGGK